MILLTVLFAVAGGQDGGGSSAAAPSPPPVGLCASNLIRPAAAPLTIQMVSNTADGSDIGKAAQVDSPIRLTLG